MIFKYLLFCSILKIVLSDKCVTFNFEDGFDSLFSRSGMCLTWGSQGDFILRKYDSIPTEPPNELSFSFISPALPNIPSCTSSFNFTVSTGGEFEAHIYLESELPTDGVNVFVNEIVTNGNDRQILTLMLNQNLPHYQRGWNILTGNIGGAGTFEGYVTIMGQVSANSILLVDAFRYIPAPREGSGFYIADEDEECIIYKDAEENGSNPTEETEETEDGPNETEEIDNGSNQTEESEDNGIHPVEETEETEDGPNETKEIDNESNPIEESEETEDGPNETEETGNGSDPTDESEETDNGTHPIEETEETEDGPDGTEEIDNGSNPVEESEETENGPNETEEIDIGSNQTEEGGETEDGSNKTEETGNGSYPTEESEDTEEGPNETEETDNGSNVTEESEETENGPDYTEESEETENGSNQTEESNKTQESEEKENGTNETEETGSEETQAPGPESADYTFWNVLTITMTVIVSLIFLALISFVCYQYGKRKGQDTVPLVYNDVEIAAPNLVPRVTRVYPEPNVVHSFGRNN